MFGPSWVCKLYAMCDTGKFQYMKHIINENVLLYHNDLIITFSGEPNIIEDRYSPPGSLTIQFFIKLCPKNSIHLSTSYPFPHYDPESIYYCGYVLFTRNPDLGRYIIWSCGKDLKELIVSKIQEIYDEGMEHYQLHNKTDMMGEINKKRIEDSILLNYGRTVTQ